MNSEEKTPAEVTEELVQKSNSTGPKRGRGYTKPYKGNMYRRYRNARNKQVKYARRQQRRKAKK